MQSLANLLIFSGPRGSGRTTALIKWAREDPINRAILVADKQRQQNLHRVYLDLINRHILPVPGLISWTLHNSRAMGSRIVVGPWQVGIDDYDQIQGEILPFPASWVRAVTLESDTYQNIPCPITTEDAIVGLAEIERSLR